MKINSFSSGCLTTLAAVLGAALLYHGCRRDRIAVGPESQTEVRYDTIPVFVDTPVARDSLVIRYKTVKVTVYDTIQAPRADTFSSDRAPVVIPITQKHYRDSVYEAWVSGYEPALDSIRVFQPITAITHTITNTEIRYKSKRWGVGVQAGIGVTSGKTEPYIGLGVTYNIFSW